MDDKEKEKTKKNKRRWQGIFIHMMMNLIPLSYMGTIIFLNAFCFLYRFLYYVCISSR